MSWKERTQMLVGAEGLEALSRSTVAIFGLGGVGSWAAEAVIRAGVGRVVLVDGDTVVRSNINRQLPATTKTLGQSKVEVMAARGLDINPDLQLDKRPVFFTAQNAADFDMEGWDYIIDAIDMVTAKLLLIERARAQGISIISSMGAGNKLDPTRFQVTDIAKTTVCPLARVIRKELRARQIRHVDVVFSTEEASNVQGRTPGSISFVPPAAGLAAAGHVIRNLMAGRTAVPR